jgi:hypothetical protein
LTEEVQKVSLPLPAQRANVSSRGEIQVLTVVASAPLTADQMAECTRGLANAHEACPELRGFTMTLDGDRPCLYVPCIDGTPETTAAILQALRTIFEFAVPHTAWCEASQVLTDACRLHLRLVEDALYTNGTVGNLIAALKDCDDVRSVTLNGETVEVLIQGHLDNQADRDRVQQLFEDLNVAIEIPRPSFWDVLGS